MRREDFTVDVSTGQRQETREWVPTLRIEFDGDRSELKRRLETSTETSLESDHVDVTFRLNKDPTESDANGVVALTNRLTGEYVLEADASADTVLSLVRAVRNDEDGSSDDSEYQLHLVAEADQLAVLEKRTLLVYGPDGDLRRTHSLIPSGVEN